MSWNFIRADQFCSFITDGTHSSPKSLKTGRKLITSKHLKEYYLDLENANCISEADYNKIIARSQVEQWDILFSMIGTIGNIYLEKSPKVEYACKNVGIFKFAGNRDDAYWMYYYLKSPQAKIYIKTHLRGSTQAYMTLSGLREMPIAIPEKNVRQQIISILRPIDERIEINNMINDNLQQQAQTIYSSMFITNADPLWKIGHLSDLVSIKYGKDHKKLTDGRFPVYGSGGIMRHVERPLYNKESVLIPRKGTLNNVIYVSQPFWSVDTMFYTEMRLPNVAKYVYHFVKSKDLTSMNAGSAVPSMTTAILNAMEVVIPTDSALKAFEEIVSPMYNEIQKNDEQSRTLCSIRDALLPRLMSGEIDISNIQF